MTETPAGPGTPPVDPTTKGSPREIENFIPAVAVAGLVGLAASLYLLFSDYSVPLENLFRYALRGP